MAVSENILLSAGVQAGLFANEELTHFRITARQERMKLLDVVMREKRFPITALYQALAEFRRIPYLTLNEITLDTDIISKLPLSQIQKRLFLPVRYDTTHSAVLVSDPDDHIAIDAVKRVTHDDITIALTDPSTVESALLRLLPKSNNSPLSDDLTTDSIALLDDIMKEAYVCRASDVHFEPEKDFMRVRFRIDGRLQDYRKSFSLSQSESIISRIKVLSSLDISEQRIPQDGGFAYHMQDWDIPETDIRVATVPCRFGERVTMRILGQNNQHLSLQQLGMSDAMLEDFHTAIANPHGILLVTGPTGSGKSTTLYATLRELDSNDYNILTVEDPIEQVVPGISQVQVSGKMGFAPTLRSFLRHDPDIMLVGEIRDNETADTALKAAMTGHLVFSTLHTNDAVGAIARLHDIGCPHYLIGSTLVGVLAQRLVRRLCEHCKTPYDASEDECEILGVTDDSHPLSLYKPVGCSHCLGTGYKGRIGIFEALWMDEHVQTLIAHNVTEEELRSNAKHYAPMMEDAKLKVIEGSTTLGEVKRLGLLKGLA